MIYLILGVPLVLLLLLLGTRWILSGLPTGHKPGSKENPLVFRPAPGAASWTWPYSSPPGTAMVMVPQAHLDNCWSEVGRLRVELAGAWAERDQACAARDQARSALALREAALASALHERNQAWEEMRLREEVQV